MSLCTKPKQMMWGLELMFIKVCATPFVGLQQALRLKKKKKSAESLLQQMQNFGLQTILTENKRKLSPLKIRVQHTYNPGGREGIHYLAKWLQHREWRSWRPQRITFLLSGSGKQRDGNNTLDMFSTSAHSNFPFNRWLSALSHPKNPNTDGSLLGTEEETQQPTNG